MIQKNKKHCSLFKLALGMFAFAFMTAGGERRAVQRLRKGGVRA